MAHRNSSAPGELLRRGRRRRELPRVSGRTGVPEIDDAPPPACARAPAVDRLVPCDREEPCPETRRFPETPKLCEGPQERFLRHVVRIGRRPGGRQRRAEHGRLMPEDQLAECRGVTLAGSGDQFVVGHSDSRHCGRTGWLGRAGRAGAGQVGQAGRADDSAAPPVSQSSSFMNATMSASSCGVSWRNPCAGPPDRPDQ